MVLIRIAIGAFLSLSLFSCAHGTVAPEALSRAEQPARAAEEAGAEKVPEAALYLKLAREQIGLAKKMAAKGDERTNLVLARAQVDAELALALAQERTTTDETAAALERVEASPSQ